MPTPGDVVRGALSSRSALLLQHAERVAVEHRRWDADAVRLRRRLDAAVVGTRKLAARASCRRCALLRLSRPDRTLSARGG
jgi:hypothetical protein